MNKFVSLFGLLAILGLLVSFVASSPVEARCRTNCGPTPTPTLIPTPLPSPEPLPDPIGPLPCEKNPLDPSCIGDLLP